MSHMHGQAWRLCTAYVYMSGWGWLIEAGFRVQGVVGVHGSQSAVWQGNTGVPRTLVVPARLAVLPLSVCWLLAA